MVIPRKRIGTEGPEVSVLSLGSWHTYDRMDFHEGAELLSRAIDAGINLFDYGFTDILFGRMAEFAGIPRDTYIYSAKLWLEGWPRRLFWAGAARIRGTM